VGTVQQEGQRTGNMRLENEGMKLENKYLELEVKHRELELEFKIKGSGNHA
jgi:hypothetical protein